MIKQIFGKPSPVPRSSWAARAWDHGELAELVPEIGVYLLNQAAGAEIAASHLPHSAPSD